MKIAVISDIHGNKAALEKALADIRSRKCDKVICLGDVVGYGYDPNGCVELCKRNCDVCLMGNHDDAVKGNMPLSWFSDTAQAGVLRDCQRTRFDNKEWLGADGYQHVEKYGDRFYAAFSHGTFSSPEEFNYIQGTYDAWNEMVAMDRALVNLLFVGHTHFTEMYVGREFGSDRRKGEGTKVIDPLKLTVVNVGSVGYPRNQPYSSYVVLDVYEKIGKATVEFVRLNFDFIGYLEKLKNAGIPVPHWMERWEGNYL